MLTVILAAPRSFCAGVDRAILIVERALAQRGAPIYVRKEIVHNRHVVSDLAARGVVFVGELDEVPDAATVVFSAHGVAPRRVGRSAAAAPGRHRRHVPAGDQGARRGQAVRRARRHGGPDRTCRARGGGRDPSWLDGVAVVGVTAGASAPPHLVEEIIISLSPAVVREHSVAQETVTFALPRG